MRPEAVGAETTGMALVVMMMMAGGGGALFWTLRRRDVRVALGGVMDVMRRRGKDDARVWSCVLPTLRRGIARRV